MDDDAVRDQAEGFARALVAGDVDAAIQRFSQELRRNLGEVLQIFPLPATDATVESVEHGGSGYNVLIRLVGETEESQILTRWKVRDGRPTIVEASHQSRIARAAEAEADEAEEPDETA